VTDYILGVETSCDDTSMGIVKSGFKELHTLTYSQIETHAQYGGVFPEVAARCHHDKLIAIYSALLEDTKIPASKLSAIAVTNKPGLVGSLLMGCTFASTLASFLNIPLIPVNHIHAHIYSSMMTHHQSLNDISFPCLGMVVSGGHTHLFLGKAIDDWSCVAMTHDDAVGECFDKVGKMMNMSYPAGPEIERLAKKGHDGIYNFKTPVVKLDRMAFSYSGLKTNLLYTIKGIGGRKMATESNYPDICYAFQRCVSRSLIKVINFAIEQHQIKDIYFGGGVCCNHYLQNELSKRVLGTCYFPTTKLSTDNATMIAGYGFHLQRSKGFPEIKPNIFH
jgi:N6-L-threonylcarbamoyladenine synthase